MVSLVYITLLIRDTWGIMGQKTLRLYCMSERIEMNPQPDRLSEAARRMDELMAKARILVERRNSGESIEDFDIRGDLYAEAMRLAPEARVADIRAMQGWLRLRGTENVVDIAAGGGFLTRRIRQWTTGTVIAVDPARQHLEHLARSCGESVRILEGSPDDAEIMREIPDASMDIVTSFGGLHHVPDQRAMMEQVARILVPGGRFMAADVGAGTPLSHHFDDVTAVKSLTGHTATWLSEERLQELVHDLPLMITRTEIVPLTWVYNSEREMALFFKGLHAYDQPEEEILADLQNALGYEERDGKIHLNWGMIFFDIERT